MNNDVFIPSWMQDEEKRSTSAPSEEFTPSWLNEDKVPEATPEAVEVLEGTPSKYEQMGSYSLPGDKIEEWGSEQVYTPEPRTHGTAKESNQSFSENVRSVGQTVLGPALGGIVSDMAGGLWNAPRNVVETGLMVREALTGRTGDVDAFNEAVPNYRAREDDGVGQILTTGTEILSGIGAGAKAGRAGAEALNLGSKGTKAAVGTGAIVGEGAAVDEDSDTIAFGENSILGLGINPGSILAEDNQGAKGLAKKLDIMVDSMAAGAAVKFGTQVGGQILSKSKNVAQTFFQYFNKTTREDNLAAEALFKMADILPTDTEEVVLKKMQGLGDYVFNNNNLMKEVFEKNPDILDSIPANERAKILETLDIQRDVARSLESAGASPASIDAARGIRKGVQEGSERSAVEVREGLAKPVNRLETQMDEIYQSGRGNMDDAAEAVRTEAQEKSQRYLDEGQKIRDEFESRKDSVRELTKDSPELKSRVDSISKNVDLDTGKSVRSSSEELAESSREASKKADETYKNALKDIPDEIHVDKDEIIKIMNENETLVNHLGETFKKAVFDEDNPLYKELLEDGSKSVTRAIDMIERTGNGTRKDIEDLQKIRKIIREDPKAAYPEYADQLKKADDAYKAWADVNKQGSVRDYRDSGRDFKFQEVDRNVQDMKITKDVAKDAYKADHLRKTLETIGKEGSVDKAVMDIAFERIRSQTNKTGDVSLKSLVDSVKQIEKGTLSPKAQSELNDVITSLRDRQAGLKAEESAVRKAETKARSQSAKVFRTDFKEFFKDTSDGMKPRGNSKKAFDDLFSNDDNVYKVQDVIQAVQKDGTKEASQGLKAGYIDSFKKKFIDQSKEGASRARSENIDEMLKYGDEIFKDEKGTMTVLRALSEEAGAASKSQTADALRVGRSSKESRAAILKGVANLVTMKYGPLSRTGARINTVSSRLADILHPEDTSKFISELVTDTAEGGRFSKELDKMISKVIADKSVVDNPSLYKEFAAYLTKSNLRTPSEIDEFFDYRFKDSLLQDEGDDGEALEITVRPKKK